MKLWARALIAAGLLVVAASKANAAVPPRTMELEILANGRLVLSGRLIDGLDSLEARLRVLREQGAPLELRLRLPKYSSFETIAAIARVIQRMGLSLGFMRDGETPAPAPIDLERSTI